MSRPAPAEAIDTAPAALEAGRMVLVTDDADRENKGDLDLAAEPATEARDCLGS